MKKKYSGILLGLTMTLFLTFPALAGEFTAQIPEKDLTVTAAEIADGDVAETEEAAAETNSGVTDAAEIGDVELYETDEEEGEYDITVFSTAPEEGQEEDSADTIDSESSTVNEKPSAAAASGTVEQRTYNGTTGWWYVDKNGKVDTSYTGFATNKNGTWYVQSGKVTKKTNGVYKDATGTIGYKNDWYYVLNSKVQYGFTGVADYGNASGQWYVTNGKVDRSYNGTYTKGKVTYTIKNGKVVKKTGGYLICIDPGHQTHANSAQEAIGPGSSTTKAKVSSGTQGVSTGIPEYQLNLTVSLKLRDELEARGYDVIMTRTTNNVNISNIERTTKANNANADALIHIHANADSDSSINGMTVACPTSSNPFVSKMCSADRSLANSILNHMVKTTGAKKRALWLTDEMTGLNWAQMPAVIVEMGFMTNPTEDKNMSKDSYQDKIVKGIADGIDEYFGVN